MATPLSVLIFAVIFAAVFCSSFKESHAKTDCETKEPRVPCTNKTCVVWTDEAVDCSNSPCGLLRAKIPNAVKTLVMRSAILKVIQRKALKGLDSLVYLDLSNNSISCIEEGAFDNLVHLEFLNLSANPYLMSYPDGFFSSLFNLRRLYLAGITQPCTFRLEALQNLSSLEVLWFGPNQLHQFPLLGTPGNIWMPNLRELSLADNNVAIIGARCYRFLPLLETLYLNGNRIRTMSIKIIRNLKRLQRFNLDRNSFFTPGSDVFQSQSLKHLSLNYITSDMAVAKRSFTKLMQLEELNLERSTPIFKIAYPFERLPNLVRLNLRGNAIRSEIIENIVKRLPKLRFLDLSENDIVVLKKSMFRNVRLDVLQLKDNWLSSIDVNSFPSSMWNHLSTLDLSRNTFECDCGILWLRRWLRDHKHNVTDIHDTNCTSPAAVKEVPVYLLSQPTDRNCFTADPDSCLGVVFAFVLVINFTATITSSLYRFRWHLKYYYFKQMSNTRSPIAPEFDDRCYVYDAFVCYSESERDRRWALDVFRARLESDFQLKLCVPDRDWPFGEDILKNFATSIEDSRRTVLILSNAFAVSSRSYHEMSAAQTRFVEENQDNLVLVLLEEIADGNKNPILRLLLQQRSYIEWTEHEVGNRMFWDKVEHALKKPPNSLIDAVPPRELFLSMGT